MSDELTTHLSPPRLLEGNRPDLDLEATLGDLPRHHFGIRSHSRTEEVIQAFRQNPRLPGVLIWDDDESQPPRLWGLLSRRQLLELPIRPRGWELLQGESVGVCHSYAGVPALILPERLTLLEAARQAFRRPPEWLGEPVVVKHGETDPIPYSILSIDELNIAHWQIRGIETQVRYERTQVQMIQSEKMASLGRMVDGVAHEILDPVGFIWGNLSHLTQYAEDLMALLSAYERHVPEFPDSVRSLREEIELDFLREDLPRLTRSIHGGAERLNRLATGLQNFCHIDDVHPKPADLQGCLDGILLLLKSRISGEIAIARHYGRVPPVSCYVGQLNQVFMNILTNAIDALINRAVRRDWVEEFGSASGFERGEIPRIDITVKVCLGDGSAPGPSRDGRRWVLIQIADNGPGMSLGEQQKILESFSTRRRADKETSLGLSYQIVTAKHGGKFELRSDLGVGTEFEIWLPLDN
ncbi:MAG: sensor histidine kinase [Limnospira sp.]